MANIQRSTDPKHELPPEELEQFQNAMKWAANQQFKVAAVEFHRSKLEGTGWWVQYILDEDNSRLQFQFFLKDGHKRFTGAFIAALTTAVNELGSPGAFADFVPEANSWYLEVPGVAVNSFAAEAIVRKVYKHDEGAKK